MQFRNDPADVLARLDALRAADAPTSGGRLLSYVYDPGVAELAELAGAAALRAQSLNGLDPTTFPSIAAMERDLVELGRGVLAGGDPDVVGSVTSGGTESCMLAVKSARDTWRRRTGAEHRPTLLIGATAHAAFHKAAQHLDLRLEVLPVDPVTARLRPSDVAAALSPDVALVVASTPSYAHGALDPVEQIAELCAAQDVPLHVDGCIGGWVLPWWPGLTRRWDLTVPGVSSLSVDLHKYGYAPKGVSLLLYRDRDRHRAHWFATTSWPGYSVVNPTLLGSRSVMPIAAGWAVTQALGEEGFAALVAPMARATERIRGAIAGIVGLRLVGDPVGPLLAIATDEAVSPERRVDPHRWSDAAGDAGWALQPQPRYTQSDGTVLPRTTHLTITPVTERVVDDLIAALQKAADGTRGIPGADAPADLVAAAAQIDPVDLTSEVSAAVLGLAGLDPKAGLTGPQADVLALVEALPAPVGERLLIEFLARFLEP
ncbi:pyridoxal phosphate-dependent decarboxylase family protein [Rhodococcus sp. W8901]|uniref:pyridoxal phosphate-dependent decarboxylase family protein n=1 Tax=Rhodococcus sp. W8901 TaxID=2742603 RepID=UPI0015816E99|nr:aminotransferase class V-fold PLP-dependent enzyme [Rhodococcus sp. W8901]QKT09809.1 aspartate aminotransferase family protein [Rhodococcus sp. W8901]